MNITEIKPEIKITAKIIRADGTVEFKELTGEVIEVIQPIEIGE